MTDELTERQATEYTQKAAEDNPKLGPDAKKDMGIFIPAVIRLLYTSGLVIAKKSNA